MNIYIHKDGTQYGPYSLEQVQQYIQQGAFTLQDQACHDGQNWIPLSQVPGIAQQAQPQAQAAPQQIQQAATPQTAANANANLIKPQLHPQRVVRTKLLSLVQLVLLS